MPDVETQEYQDSTIARFSPGVAKRSPRHVVLGLDSGMHTGWAVFIDGQWSASGELRFRKRVGKNTANDIATQLIDLLKDVDHFTTFDLCVCEDIVPRGSRSSRKSLITMGANRASLLAAVKCLRLLSPPAATWMRGRGPHRIASEAKAISKLSTVGEHEADAIMLCEWGLAELRREPIRKNRKKNFTKP